MTDMFNSVSVSMEVRISAARSGADRQIDSLDRRIARAEQQVGEALARGKFNAPHQKKRRLFSMTVRLASLGSDEVASRVRLCFGSKKPWLKQYHLEFHGYSSHAEWKKDWDAARSDEFSVLGSKDETSGCQMCVARRRMMAILLSGSSSGRPCG